MNDRSSVRFIPTASANGTDTMCSPQGTCVAAVCATNKECQDAHPTPGAATDPWICRHVDHKCAALFSQDCKKLLHDLKLRFANDFGPFLRAPTPPADDGLPDIEVMPHVPEIDPDSLPF